MREQNQKVAGEIRLYQIYFNEGQLGNLYDFATPYFNEGLTVFFENEVIKQIVPRETSDKVGVCSWQLRQKVGNGIPMRQPFTKEVLEWDYDVLSLGREQKEHSMLSMMETWHTGSRAILSKIWAAIGKSLPKEPKHPIYSNHFMARTDIYQEYVKDFLIPAMEVMENDEEIKKRCYEDSHYFKLIRDPGGYGRRIKETLGMDYIPLHTFLLERCFSCWINDKRLNVIYL